MFLNKKYYLLILQVFVFTSFNSQIGHVKISNIDFNYNGEAVEIYYNIANGGESDFFNVDVKGITKKSKNISLSSIEGDLTDLKNGKQNLLWYPEKDNIIINEDLSFQFTISQSSNYQISKNKHIVKSLIMPGLGDYKLKNGKHYILYGLAAYGSIYGSYHYNQLANENYSSYLNSNDYNQAQSFYKSAKQQQLFSRLLSVASGIIWTVDLISINKHYKKVKANLNENNSKHYFKKANQKYEYLSDKKQINTKKPYLIAFEQLQQLYKNKNYEAANETILMVKELEPSDEILLRTLEIEDDIKAYYKKEEDYKNAIVKGDLFLIEGKYDEAIDEYKKAKLLKTEEEYPVEKIKEATNKINAVNTEDRYKQLIDKGDLEFNNGNYLKAIDYFKKALDIFDRSYPKEKIRDAENKITEKNRKIREQKEREEKRKIDSSYNLVIKKADLAFQQKKYEKALDLYDEALALKRNETKPRERKELIKKILANSNENNYEQKVKTFAVIVGLERYKYGYSSDLIGVANEAGVNLNGVLSNLNYTENDAFRFQSFLQSSKGGFTPEENIIFLTENDATYSNILSSLRKIMYKASNKDRVIFYFSGHGSKTGLCPYDYVGEDDNSISKKDIERLFSSTNAKYKLLIADACYSGNLKGTKGLIQEEMIKFDKSLSSSSGGYAVIQSSSGYETSMEDGALKQGVFSHYLLKGLKGAADNNNNKIVTISELFNYIKYKVPSHCRSKYGHSQHPQLDGNYDPNMPMSIVK